MESDQRPLQLDDEEVSEFPTDSMILSRNRAIDLDMTKSCAKETWSFGKELGAVAQSDDVVVVDKLMQWALQDGVGNKGGKVDGAKECRSTCNEDSNF